MNAKRKDSPVLCWGRAKVVEVFGADLRSLAALRIALGLLVLSDLAGRVVDLTAHYTDEGVLPRSALLDDLLHPYAFSLNLVNGEPFFQALLFSLREGVSWEKPESVAATLKNKYWRKYLGEIRLSDNKELRKPFASYICRQWNAHHTGGEQLAELQLVFMRETTLPDYQPPTPEKVVLREHSCS